ncbi:hypothetical protein SARC_05422 [Sphaeroforma arctica JP610]|uniref:Reverse transcriptase domain-containing protein n=1 Tax=Sphaeroforma arctica JP610 TaxID=667725 RepID=A0A0L0G266_9EUKA|nr:hypothetical protein SARC_05422 [Sphaeroforma arctica JP610]KNC82288.1 hypothetical protein SARC_05422 [Sphaeroforma arctica JP610]|eukprot:XP_014156190.1 hypothetical protein SARC_05422 [Sphaeroforma arctica JP610]
MVAMKEKLLQGKKMRRYCGTPSPSWYLRNPESPLRPRMTEGKMFGHIAGKPWVSVVDCGNAFNQIPLERKSKDILTLDSVRQVQVSYPSIWKHRSVVATPRDTVSSLR